MLIHQFHKKTNPLDFISIQRICFLSVIHIFTTRINDFDFSNFIPIWKFAVLPLLQFFSEIPKTIIMRHNNFQRRFAVCHNLSSLFFKPGFTVNIILLCLVNVTSSYWNGTTSFSASSVEIVLAVLR